METKEALERIVDRLASEWGLITVGEGDDFNMMTIAWGQAGNLWWKPVVTAYAHPSRYTYGFLERNDYFVISLFPSEYKDDLQILGTKSGRDGDKLALTKLTPKAIEHGYTYEEADTTIVCRKIYAEPLNSDVVPAEIMDQYYLDGAVHTQFIGEIVAAF